MAWVFLEGVWSALNLLERRWRRRVRDPCVKRLKILNELGERELLKSERGMLHSLGGRTPLYTVQTITRQCTFSRAAWPKITRRSFWKIENPCQAKSNVYKKAIVWCLEPPIARFGSLILKVVIVPTHSTNPATGGFGYCFPCLSHLSSKFILLISPSLLNGFAPFNL